VRVCVCEDEMGVGGKLVSEECLHFSVEGVGVDV